MVRDIRGERQRLGDGAAETGMAAVIAGTTVTNVRPGPKASVCQGAAHCSVCAYVHAIRACNTCMQYNGGEGRVKVGLGGGGEDGVAARVKVG